MLAAITFKNTPISVPTPSQNNPPTRQAVTGKQGAATWQWGVVLHGQSFWFHSEMQMTQDLPIKPSVPTGIVFPWEKDHFGTLQT